ncbi:MAG: efflux RND transporter periplasmic adaptor subunit [Alphaproteobacteria bacterium]|nr:efflux RND transporter periplasmic adaptor subunit [Alphaproteobacteria bacterium]
MKKLKILAIILVLISGTVYAFYSLINQNHSELTLYGNIEIRQVTLGFQVSGKIIEMRKEEGDSVKKGEIIAVLDSKDYENSLEMARANVKKTKAICKEAKSKYEKNAPLCRKNILAQQDFDTLLRNKDQAEADYQAAVASEKSAENQLSYTKIYAPDDGIITTRIQEPGSIIAAGQGIYTMCKNNPVWVRAYVSEIDLGNIKYGMKVRIVTDSVNPETNKVREYEGQIGYISPVAEFTPKTVQSTDQRANLVYKIRVYIDNKDDFLRQGMPTTIKINLKSI